MRIPNLLLPLFGICACALTSFAADILTPKDPVKLPGKPGKFDFLEVDADRGRLLAAHTGAAALEVFDFNAGKILKTELRRPYWAGKERSVN